MVGASDMISSHSFTVPHLLFCRALESGKAVMHRNTLMGMAGGVGEKSFLPDQQIFMETENEWEKQDLT